MKAEHGEVDNWNTTPTITADKTWVWDGTQGGTTYSMDQVGNWKKYYNNGTDDERTHSTVNEMTARTVGGTARNLCLPKTPSGAATAGISVTMKGNRGFWPA